jgi:hypothetical protein
MDERGLAEFIDRIIRESKIPHPRVREELRRELESHFADVGGAPDAWRAAVERFGSPADVSGALERTHRRSRFLTNLLRIATALAAASLVAVAIQLIANLHINAEGSIIGLGRGFARSVAFATTIVIALVAAWELDIDSFCARLEKHPLRLCATVLGLSTIMLLFHAAENTLVAPGRAIIASAVDVVIWTCTIAILAQTDRGFARVFTPLER